MEGILLKKSQGFIGSWLSRFYMLDEDGLEYFKDRDAIEGGTRIGLEEINSVVLTKEGFTISFKSGKSSKLKGDSNAGRHYVEEWVAAFHTVGVKTFGLEEKKEAKQTPKRGWGNLPDQKDQKLRQTKVVVDTKDINVSAEDLATPDVASAPEQYSFDQSIDATGGKRKPNSNHSTDDVQLDLAQGEVEVSFKPQMSVGIDYNEQVIIKVWEDTQAWRLGVKIGMKMVKIDGAQVPNDDDDLQGLLVSLVQGTESFTISFQHITHTALNAKLAKFTEMDNIVIHSHEVKGDNNVDEKVQKMEEIRKEQKMEEVREDLDVELLLRDSVANLQKRRISEYHKSPLKPDSSLELILGTMEDGDGGDFDLELSSDSDRDEDSSKHSDMVDLDVDDQNHKYENLLKEINEEDDDDIPSLPLTQESLGLDDDVEIKDGDDNKSGRENEGNETENNKGVENQIKGGDEEITGKENKENTTEDQQVVKQQINEEGINSKQKKEEETEDQQTVEQQATIKRETNRTIEPLGLEDAKELNFDVSLGGVGDVVAVDSDVKSCDANMKTAHKDATKDERSIIDEQILNLKDKLEQKQKETEEWQRKCEEQSKINKKQFLKLKLLIKKKKETKKSAKIAEKDKMLALLVKNYKMCHEKMILIRKRASRNIKKNHV